MTEIELTKNKENLNDLNRANNRLNVNLHNVTSEKEDLGRELTVCKGTIICSI
jgi:hypothetical protein